MANSRHLRVVCIALALWLLLVPGLHAQDSPRTYTVVAGDTLFVIAQRFGVSLDELVAANGITNPDRLEIGQVLIIPTPGAGPAGVPTTGDVRALPGDTIASIAQRTGQSPEELAASNGLSVYARLFPGQPLQVPRAAIPEPPLRYGAITQVRVPERLVQGRTGVVIVEARRNVTLSATWNDLPLTFLPLDAEGRRQFAYLPVPALIAPASYWLTVSYLTGDGLSVSRSWMIPVAAGGYDSQVINLPPDRGALLDPALVQAEAAKVNAVWSERTPVTYWTGPFSLPIGAEYPTTSPFGTRRSYNAGPFSDYHAGQDFGAPTGVPVFVPGDGVVLLVEMLTVRGGAVIIDHGGGVLTGYWHLSEITVQVGQAVAQGDVLGLVGNTGLSTGAHLHWELRIYGIAVDPMQFLQEPLVPLPAG